jgi:simple sugar transport system permease protein
VNLDLFLSEEAIQTTVAVATPLLMAGFGEVILERSGIMNLSIEGMVTLGAATTFVVVFVLGGSGVLPVVAGLAAGALAAVLVGCLLAGMTIRLRGNQVAVGLALLVLSLGLASLLYRLVIGTPSEQPRIDTLPRLPIPLLSDIPVVGGILFNQNAYVYVAYLLTVPIVVFLFRTPIGLKLRAVGENPKAADTLGLPVARLRWTAVLLGSSLIGLAGAFFPLSLTGTYEDTAVGGRGWLALMLVIFARWHPKGVLIGGLLFAYVDSLQFRVGAYGGGLPPELLQMVPYVLAIVTLVLAYGRAAAPAALGKPYDREARF